MSASDLTPRLPLPARALALVLTSTGGDAPAGEARRLSPAHFGGKFRSVDFVLSNCMNSGMRRIGVLSPHHSHSLQRHLKRSWSFLKGDGCVFIELLSLQPLASVAASLKDEVLEPAPMLDLLMRSSAEFVLVLTGERIYKMNYASMLADHVAKGRACTVACLEGPPGEPPDSAWVEVDTRWRVVACGDAIERAALDAGRRASPSPRRLLNTGIYIFNRSHLLDALTRPGAAWLSPLALERDLLAHAVNSAQASAHSFALSCIGTVAGRAPYWRDVGSVDAYWDANIDLTASVPQLDLYDPNWPMRAQQAELAPAKFLHNQADRRGLALESLVSGGCIISGSVLRSVLFHSVRVHSYAEVEWSVLLPSVQVGRHARLRRVVVERGCIIPDGLVIGEDPQMDAARFFRTELGITLVTADMLARLPPFQPAPVSLKP